MDGGRAIVPHPIHMPVPALPRANRAPIRPDQSVHAANSFISGMLDLPLSHQPLKPERQFAATRASEHHMLPDDAAGGTGPQPIELVAVGLAGCTEFDVVPVLRQKRHQKVTGYKVRVEADHERELFDDELEGLQ
jgi:hypothetical protein